jgi:hypothetical protein
MSDTMSDSEESDSSETDDEFWKTTDQWLSINDQQQLEPQEQKMSDETPQVERETTSQNNCIFLTCFEAMSDTVKQSDVMFCGILM